MISNFAKPIFINVVFMTVESCSFLNTIKILLLFRRNPFYASHPEEYWWSQEDSRGHTGSWRLEGVLGVPGGPGGTAGLRDPRDPCVQGRRLGPTFPPCPNFIVWLALLLEILGNVCIAIICFSIDEVINFEINLSFSIKLFSYMIKKVRTKIQIS